MQRSCQALASPACLCSALLMAVEPKPASYSISPFVPAPVTRPAHSHPSLVRNIYIQATFAQEPLTTQRPTHGSGAKLLSTLNRTLSFLRRLSLLPTASQSSSIITLIYFLELSMFLAFISRSFRYVPKRAGDFVLKHSEAICPCNRIVPQQTQFCRTPSKCTICRFRLPNRAVLIRGCLSEGNVRGIPRALRACSFNYPALSGLFSILRRGPSQNPARRFVTRICRRVESVLSDFGGRGTRETVLAVFDINAEESYCQPPFYG